MMTEKTVSVYINAYNAENFIEETINSILNQTYKNLKIIVIDDCSTDKTLEILKSIKDERLSIYSLEENSHICTALNEGLKRMDGEYVAHCDADDLWEPTKIEKQLEFLEAHPEYGACFTHIDIIDEMGNIDGSLFPVETYNIENRSQAEMFYFLCNNSNHFAHSCFFTRKEIIEKVGLYDYSMPTLHDYDYWLRLLTVTPVFVIEENLTKIRRHSNNHSVLDEGLINCNDSEHIRSIKKAVLLCPDNVFLNAFNDILKFKGQHSPEETLIEKAFALEKITTTVSYNPVMAVEVFSDILNNSELSPIAKEKFGFTPKKLNEMEKNKQYHNYYFELNRTNHIALLTEQIAQKDEQYKTDISSLKSKIDKKDADIDYLNSQISEFQKSFFWRLTKPMRTISQTLKDKASKNKTFLHFLIFTKAFLRGGPKALKEKYRIIYHLSPKAPVVVPQEISKKQREFESGTKFENNVKFSILVPLYNTPKDFLTEMIDSVLNQTYSNWELCLADGSTNDFGYVGEYCLNLSEKDNRIIYKKLAENKGISENTNACIEMASGDYIALFDHDDLLHPSALYEYAKVINEQNADFIYCDEDKFEKLNGKFYDPYYKPDFAPDNLRANNYICHFTVFKKSLLETVGKFRKEFDGSQDHDLVLRLTEKAQNVVHIPKILYRWRVSSASVASDPYAKPYTITAGINAVKEHLERVGLKGNVESSPYHPNFYRIKYNIIGNPLVSILIPNYNHKKDLDRCITSIIEKSTYKNYEIVIIENNSNEETFKYYETLKKYDNVKVIVYKPEPNEFNYSAINNFGFKHTNGEHIILLNNDIEIISPNWIEEMLMFSQRSDVGAVGAKLYYPNDTIQHAGVILGIGGVAGHSHKYYPKDNTGYFGRLICQQNLSCVTAACLMIRRSVFEQIDGLDETFKVAFNDVDMCMRIRKAGYNIIFTPYAELYHYESISRGLENTDEKKERFLGEVVRFKSRWQKELNEGDPYYNPNLTLDREDFSQR